ncbi:MAG TPA: phage tail protein [Puia sp.]|jgi:phage tail-like protein|nr:phage tail protein [Puia sp.]
MGLFTYPLTGFHFLVTFELSPIPIDMTFQEVSGLSVEAQYDPYKSGGQNGFEYRLPVRPKYSDLVLKRGYPLVSGISAWMIDAFENYNYQPTNLVIALLDEEHIPVSSWYVINALPVKWDLSSFNAEESRLAIETMTLRYDRFRTLNLSAAVAAVINALTGGGDDGSDISFP